jgi:hypothetical protein
MHKILMDGAVFLYIHTSCIPMYGWAYQLRVLILTTVHQMKFLKPNFDAISNGTEKISKLLLKIQYLSALR